MQADDVLIIGAGMAGLTAALELQRSGVASVLIDKGHKPGGRMATRTIGEARFDHGAQHFGLRDPEFRRVANEWMSGGLVREWYHADGPNPDGSANVRHAGRGGMRRLAEHLARGLRLHTSVKATRLDLSSGRVVAHDSDHALASGRALIITAPVPQTLELLEASAIEIPGDLHDALLSVSYNACLAAMACLDGTAGLPAGHATPDGGPIAWVGDNEHKGVSEVPAVTIHSTPEFAAQHMNSAVDEWTKTLCEAAAPLLASPITEATGHRWRYSEPRHTFDMGAVLIEADAPIVLAGEVFAGARIEGAYLSGREAARQLLERL